MKFLYIPLGLLLASVFACTPKHITVENKKPNVVLIISDQWSTRIADGAGNYSNGIQTPGIDQLASEGIRFTQSYSTYPLCTPARASIYTGLYPHNNKVTRNEEQYRRTSSMPDPTAVATLGREFKKAGYETAYFGKEHAANYAWEGIDVFGSMTHSAGGLLAEGSAYDQIFTKDAMKFIKKEHDKPFYMTLSLINPHDICKVLGGKVKGATFADAINLCRGEKDVYLRSQPCPDLPDNHYAPYVKGMIPHNDFMFDETSTQSESDWKRFIAAYYLLIENTDWYIGLVLEALRESGLEENTIVLFTTDHGEMAGSHQLIAKTNFYEESARTQMIIRYPGKIIPGSVDNEALVGSIDVMPTLLDMCGIPQPDGLDGQSFKSRCYGQSEGDFSELYAVNGYGRMVRFGPYKYVRTEVYGQEFEILFDLEKDPNETTNEFENTGYEEISMQARSLLNQWMVKENIGLTY